MQMIVRLQNRCSPDVPQMFPKWTVRCGGTDNMETGQRFCRDCVAANSGRGHVFIAALQSSPRDSFPPRGARDPGNTATAAVDQSDGCAYRHAECQSCPVCTAYDARRGPRPSPAARRPSRPIRGLQESVPTLFYVLSTKVTQFM